MYRILIKTIPGVEDIYLAAETQEDLFSEVNNMNITMYLPMRTLNYLEECIVSVSPETPTSYCPNIFDSEICFQATPPNTTQFSPCPREHPLFNAVNKSAEKLCLSDGSWWRHPLTNMTFSNYNPCVPQDKFSEHMTMTTLNTVGIIISLILLLLSLLIFYIFSSSLSCGRVSMHKNLFLACSLRNTS